MSPISNLLYNYPKHERVHVVWLHLYKVQEQAKLMIIETGTTKQPLESRVWITVKKHKKTFGGEENVLYFDSILHSVLSNAFAKTLQTVRLGSVHSNVWKLILNF